MNRIVVTRREHVDTVTVETVQPRGPVAEHGHQIGGASADPRTVVTVVETDPADANYAPLRENLRRLRAATDEAGRALEIVELPMPAPVVWQGQRLPASYANFYVGNEVVLVPTFDDAHDANALALLGRCFPDRRIVGIDSTALVWGLGAFHCATQQQPAVATRVFRPR